PSTLAARAVESRALPEAHAPDGAAAARATFARAPVNQVLLLKITGAAVGMHEVAQAAAAGRDRRAQRGADRLNQPDIARPADAAACARGMDAGAEQRLVRIDVAHAAHQMVVHEEVFDGRVAPAGSLEQPARVESALERFGS